MDVHGRQLLHLAGRKTLCTLQGRYFWPGMTADVHRWVATCVKCARRKPPPRVSRAPLQPITVTRVNELVALDILGPLPVTPRGNKYLLVGVEYCTRWPMAWALPDQTAQTIADAFVGGYVLDKGAPERLLTDQGRNFSSRLLKDVCSILGTKKVRTSPYHPQTDGMVEGFNRTIAAMLSQVVDENHSDWDLHIPSVLAAYRVAPHAATGFSPFFLMYGRDPVPPIEVQLTDIPARADAWPKALKTSLIYLREARQAAEAASATSQESNVRIRERTVTAKPFKVGDQAWLHCPQVPVGLSPKLHRPWKGPVKVIKAHRPQCVQVQLGKRRWFVHPTRLKPYISPPSSSPTSPPTSLPTSSSSLPRPRSPTTTRRPAGGSVPCVPLSPTAPHVRPDGAAARAGAGQTAAPGKATPAPPNQGPRREGLRRRGPPRSSAACGCPGCYGTLAGDLGRPRN